MKTHASRWAWREVADCFFPLFASASFFWFLARASSRWLPPDREMRFSVWTWQAED